MRHEDHIDHAELELATILGILSSAPPEAAVPTCPGFEVYTLGSHLNEICGFWAHVVAEAIGWPTDDLPDDLAGRGALLIETLRAADADTPAWSWYEPDQRAAFASRRCCHELTIHRVDLQAAVEVVTPIPLAVARDGIEEFLLLSTVRADRGSGDRGRSGTIHLHGTDDEAEWMLTVTADGLEVERRHAKGDVAVRGTVSDLELLLYGRTTVDELESFGQLELFDDFRSRFSF